MDRRRAAVDRRIPAAAPNAPNKDPFTHEQEKERFLRDLRQFHEGRGTTVPRWPYIGGKPVDLHALYTAVTQLGGWEKISNDETWINVQEQFGIPASCSNADYALRQIYIRYLNAYERLHHFGQDPDSRDDTTDLDDLPSSRKKTSAAGPIGGVAVTYNYQQHNITESTRELLGLPKKLNQPSEYSRIERSLMSGLPNELDVAVNICLLLSTESKHVLKGAKALRIVELLLSHVGISREAELALIWLIPDSKLNFLKFWNESIDDHEVKEILCPECLLVDKVEEYRTENGIGACDSDPSKVLHLGRGLGTEDCEAHRVVQLAVILRNLSLEEENLECFASSLLVFRFTMLCIYSRNVSVRQLALDTMANIAFKIDVLFLRKMTIEPVDCGLSRLVLRTVSAFLASPDKFEVVNALEMLSRLCQVELNEDAICTQLGDATYEHLVQLLTIQDLQLIVSALETIYQLSEIGAATSNRIASVRASVDVLVALLTVDAQSYGPCSLPGIVAEENAAEVQIPVQSQAMGPPPSRPAPPLRPPLPLPCMASHTSVTPSSQSPLPPRPPPILPMPAPPSLTPQTLASTVRPASVSVFADSEAAACNWLLAQYELSANSSLKKMEMYRRYASVFGVYGLQNLVSPMSFASCIRVTFPSVEQGSVDRDGTNEVVYKGLTNRQKPGLFSPSTGDLPPGHQMILSVSTGAALALTKPGQMMTQSTPQSSTGVTFPAIQQVLQSSHLRQDSLILPGRADGSASSAVKSTATAPTETNLVKTLLASKVTQNMNRMQVQQTDGQQTHLQQTAPGTNLRIGQECNAADGSLSNTNSFRHILTTVPQNSHCRVSATNAMSQGVLSEHTYIQTPETLPSNSRFCVSASVNGKFAIIVANQNAASVGQSEDGRTAENLTNCDDDRSRDFERLTSEAGCLNAYKPAVCRTVESVCAIRPTENLNSSDGRQVANAPVVMNGTFGPTPTGIPGKSQNNSHVAEQLNGKEPLSALNGVVKDLVNGDRFNGNSNPESVQLPAEEMETWSGSNQNQPETIHHTAGSSYAATTRDAVSPFPRSANVDGLSDDVSEGALQGGDKTTSTVLTHLCHDPDRAGMAVDGGRSQMPAFELNCGYAAAPDNSEVLLLEDFTVAHQEEVLVSDMSDQTGITLAEMPSIISRAFTSCVDECESHRLGNPQEISRAASSYVVQNSQDCAAPHSLDSVKNSFPILTSMSQPLPIMIPANIQAKLASFQDGSSLSVIGQVPFNAMHSSVPQSFVSTQPSSSSSAAIFQRPLINQNYMTSFSQMFPVNDTGQQHAIPEILSNSQGSCEISSDLLQPTVPLSAEAALQIDGSHVVYQTPTESHYVAAQSTGVATEMLNTTVNQLNQGQNPQQMVIGNPHGVQSSAVPVLPQTQQQNSSSVFVASSSAGSNASQGTRLQFMTSSMTSNLSNSVRIPQLHRFVTTTTPGRIIIQRAQIVPQGQQTQLQQGQQLQGQQLQGQQLQGQQQQSLRPLQQPFYQRFIVSQAGGLPQRQILIQSSPVLMHQGTQGTGQARPVFVPQTGQASTGQPVVMSPSGQIFSQPQQRHAGQAGQLTAYRLAPIASHSGHLVQHQAVGQSGQQGHVSRPIMMQKTQPSVQQGQMVMQPGQQMGLQDSKSAGQSADQQSQGHGPVIVPNHPISIQQNQMGQVITHQGQASHIFTQQGQLLVGQQGQILCHPGQQSQGQNAGPVVIQHNGGQFVLHSGSSNLPGCLMSIPVSSFQHGVGMKRLVETSQDQTAGPSLCLSTSTGTCRIITANTPLNSGLGITANAQQTGGLASPSSVSSSGGKKRKPAAASSSQPRLVKKRKKDGEDQTGGDEEPGLGKTPVQYLCEWNGCNRCFGSFNSIFQHVTKDHFVAIKESSITCEWSGCDITLKRQRWSFMTHLQDRHLNETCLRAAASRRQQQSSGATSPSPQSSAVPTTAIYPPNAALQAIRRFSARPPFPELSDAKDSPISKHIHLTSALILRNLARYSSLGRSFIKKHEKHLALIAFSETESSSAISNCLWELHRH